MIIALIILAILVPLSYKLGHRRGFTQGVSEFWFYKDTDREDLQ